MAVNDARTEVEGIGVVGSAGAAPDVMMQIFATRNPWEIAGVKEIFTRERRGKRRGVRRKIVATFLL